MSGTRADNSGHVEYVCTCHRVGCMFCDGGLFRCTICDSFEGATTTQCPGRKMSKDEIDRVYAGVLDFREGEWVNAPSGSCSSHYGERPGLPEAA
jgi:hypothetical protein